MTNRTIIAGQTFWQLTFIECVDKKKRKWLCRCSCGNTVVAFSANVKRGNTKSCGCLNARLAKERLTERWAKKGVTHGKAQTPEYNIWCGMKARCAQPSNNAFLRYGARGIFVCARWLDSFGTFLADMGERPTTKHSLDRIDNNGPYSPDNCRWATATEQARNTRKNRYITHDGVVLTHTEWETRLSIPQGRIYSRLKLGWTEHDALFGKPI